MAAKLRISFAIPVVVVVSVVSLLLQLVGYVAPGWTIIEYGSVTHSAGLWYMRICSAATCTTKSIMDLEQEVLASISYMATDGIVGLQTEASVALVLTLLATITVLFFRKFPQHHVTLIFVIAILIVCHFLSGAVAFAACGTKAQKTIEQDHAYDFGIPYCLVLTGLGAVLNVTAILFLLLHLRHVIHTLKRQADRAPFYSTSQMRQPLTKYNPESAKTTKTPKSRTVENDPGRNYDSGVPEKAVIENGFEQHAIPRKHRSKPSKFRDIHHATSPQTNHQDTPDVTIYKTQDDILRKQRLDHSEPATIPHTHYNISTDNSYDYTQGNQPRMSRSNQSSYGYNHPDTSPHLNDYGNADLDCQYKQHDSARKPSGSNQQRYEQTYPDIWPKINSQCNDAMDEHTQSNLPRKPTSIRPGNDISPQKDMVYPDNSEYNRGNLPRKSHPKRSRIGRNKEPMTDVSYYENAVAADEYYPSQNDFVQAQTIVRPSSYYEKLELDSEHRAHPGPAPPVESTV